MQTDEKITAKTAPDVQQISADPCKAEEVCEQEEPEKKANIPNFGKKRMGVWTFVNGASERLYDRIVRCPIGKFFTSYRSFDKGVFGGGWRSDRVHGASKARHAVKNAADSGHVYGFMTRLATLLFAMPTSFYGLFAFLTATLALIAMYVVPLTPWQPGFVLTSPLPLIALMLITLPLSLSRKPLYKVIGRSAVMHLLLVRFLGVPEDTFATERRSDGKGYLYFSYILIPVAAYISLKFGPWYVPIGILSIGLLGLIFTFPESGVIFSCATLPLFFFTPNAVYLTSTIIILVWISYLSKLVRMHRTIRMDILDAVVLMLGSMIFVGGFTGRVITQSTVIRGCVLFVLLSIYFLIVNLMAGRAYLKRCLVGVLLASIAASVGGIIGSLSPEAMKWISGSVAGDVISELWAGAVSMMSDANSRFVIYAAITLPLVYAAFVRSRRIIATAGLVALTALDIVLILFSWSRGIWFCVIAGLVVFFILYSHVALSVAVFAIPISGCILVWLDVLLAKLNIDITHVVARFFGYGASGGGPETAELYLDTWDMIAKYPFGVGIGADSVNAAYAAHTSGSETVATFGNTYLDILAGLGVVGILVFALMMFLFVQKAFTCLRYTAGDRDRWTVLGGLVCILMVMLIGVIRSITVSSAVYYAIWIIFAVVSAYANITFNEYDVLGAATSQDVSRQDKLFKA